MSSILVYDEHCGWSPSLNASKGTGGTEVHLVQIATWLSARGHMVGAECHIDDPHFVDKVSYVDSRKGPYMHQRVDVLLTVRRSKIPTHVTADKVFTLVTDDPRGQADDFAHLRGRSTLVCVSEWQAGLYREQGHTCVVIPAMLDDRLYCLTRHAHRNRYVCLSAWNKGTQATLDAWDALRERVGERWLEVGCPYSAPDDAADRCAAVGATWLGTLRPSEIVTHMARADAHMRICTIAETFGATDAIARALGVKTIVLCEGDVGALPDTIGHVWTQREAWERAVIHGHDAVQRPTRDFSVSKVMPMWLKTLGLE